MGKNKRTMKEIQDVLLMQQQEIDHIAETVNKYVPRIELLARTVLGVTNKLGINCLDPKCSCQEPVTSTVEAEAGKDFVESLKDQIDLFEERCQSLEKKLAFETEQKQAFHRAAVKFEADSTRFRTANTELELQLGQASIKIANLQTELTTLKTKAKSRPAPSRGPAMTKSNTPEKGDTRKDP